MLLDGIEIPDNEIYDKEQELLISHRKKANEMDLGEAVSESRGETRDAINLALAYNDSAALGQACISALFDHIRKELVTPGVQAFIEKRKDEILHEDSLSRRAVGE